MKLTILAALAATTLATAATAQSYSPVIAGAPNTANFQFGYDTGSGFTQYGALIANCPRIVNTSCYLRDAGNPGDFLGAYFVPTDTATQGAILFSSDATLHPGPGVNELSVVRFIAPTAGAFRISGFFRGVDAPGSGNGQVVTPNNGSSLVFNNGVNNAFNFTSTLAAGGSFDFAVGNNGNYSNDTTGLNLSISAVPEPATWGMMMLGLGMVGFGLRRRKGAASTIVRFA